MSSFAKAWPVVKMAYKAHVCPRCELPTMIPDEDWKGRVDNMTCMNCGYYAYKKPTRMRGDLMDDDYKDKSKERSMEIFDDSIKNLNESGFAAGQIPNTKGVFEAKDIRNIFAHPLEMILADTGHESLTDLIRAYARLKAEKDSRLPDSLRGTPEGEHHESEMAEEAMRAFEERNADHLSNAFINWKRNQEGGV